MKILYCTTVLPGARRTGGEIASQAFIGAMRQAGHEVSVLGYRRPGDQSPLRAGEVEIGQRPIETDAAGRRALFWLAAAILAGRPYSVQKYVSPAYVAEVKRRVTSGEVDLMVIDHAQMGYLLDHLPSGIPLVVVAHNVEADIYRGQALSASGTLRRWLARREAKKIAGVERRLAARAQQVWVLTAGDRAQFSAQGECRNVVVCAIPASDAFLSDGRPVGAEVVRDVGILGTWTWGANADGLRWFQREVVPRLPAGWCVEVAGKGGADIVSDPVKALGFVDDAAQFLRGSRVVCIPSTAGGGVQVKTLDAIATGRPVVATSVAVRGIDAPPGGVLCADGADAFVEALERAVGAARGEADEASVAWSLRRRDQFNQTVLDCLEQLGQHEVKEAA